MNKSPNHVLCTDCQKPMIKKTKNQAVWWVCCDYPHCSVTAFEYRGRPKFCHEEPNVKPPIEMPLYLV